MGLDLKTYWRITPRLFEKYVNVYIQKEKDRMKEMDVNNYNLGVYIAYAVNDPKKYPKKPLLAVDTQESVRMTDSEMKRIMKENIIKMGGKIVCKSKN